MRTTRTRSIGASLGGALVMVRLAIMPLTLASPVLASPVLFPAAAPGPDHAPTLALAIEGAAETVFDHERDACARWDAPDAPARAWRDALGFVRLIAGAAVNRAMSGPLLNAVSRDCAIVHVGGENDDPSAYDDHAWIAAIFTEDGRRVEALAHVEYHGHRRPTLCPSGDYMRCWRNVVTEVVALDGDVRFRRSSQGALVAALPYRYDGGQRHRTGYFNPSNMIRVGDHLYAFVFAEAYGAQRRGACLLRRPVNGGAADWRAFNGDTFAIRFIDPYRERPADPAAHVCAPVAGVSSTISSVIWHEKSRRFIAVTPAARQSADRESTSGVWWMSSPDLQRWSAPELLLAAPLLWRRDCDVPHAFAYPSLLDDDSPARMFDAADDRFWLYLTRIWLADCKAGPRRDLVRYRVILRQDGRAG